MNDKTQLLAERLQGIGGSDAAAICGLSPWETALQVYLEKRGEIEQFKGNEKTKWGIRMENLVALAYVEESGRKVRRIPMRVSAEHPYMLVHMDRQIIGDDRGPGYLECKTTDKANARQWINGPPDEYQLQVQHGLAVTGYRWAVIAVLIGGNHYEQFEIERNEKIIEKLIEIESAFWNNNVLAGVPPEPDYDHPRTGELLARMYGSVALEKTVVLAEPLIHWAFVEQDAARQITTLQKVRDGAKARIQAAMEDAGVGVLPPNKEIQGQYVRTLTKKQEHIIPASEFITMRFRGRKGEGE